MNIADRQVLNSWYAEHLRKKSVTQLIAPRIFRVDKSNVPSAYR